MKNKSPKSKEARLGDLIHSITRRDPSKRQIKPINTDNLILDDLDDESDDEYVFDGKDDDSSSDGSESGSQDEDEDSSSQGSESDESESGNSCTDNAEVEVIDVDTSKEGKNSTQKSAACITELLTNDLSGPPNALDKVSLEAEGLFQPSQKLSERICMLCLGEQNSSNDEIIECDACKIVVHEDCHKIHDDIFLSSSASSSDTDPWFCEPCLAGVENPQCELCPNLGGVFKRTDNHRWVHLICALYTPGVAFNYSESLTEVTLTEMPAKEWSLRECSLCDDKFFAWTGVCISCDAGLCKNYFHVTCAQKQGLLAEPAYEENPSDPFFAQCRQHTDKTVAKTRRRNYLICVNRSRVLLKMAEEQQRKNLQANSSEEFGASTGDTGLFSLLDERLKRKLDYFRGLYQHMLEKREKPYTRPTKAPLFLENSPVAVRAFVSKAMALGLPLNLTGSSAITEASKSAAPGCPVFLPDFISYVLDREKRLEELAKRLSALESTQRQLQLSDADVSHNYNSLSTKLADLTTKLKENRRVAKNYVNHLQAICKSFKDTGALSKLLTALESTEIQQNKDKVPTIDSAGDTKDSFNDSVSGATCSRAASIASRRSATTARRSLLVDRHLAINRRRATKQVDESLVVAIAPPAKAFTNPTGAESIIHECSVCNGLRDQHLLTICETCKKAFHIACLDPPLARVPKQSRLFSWQCSTCTKAVVNSSEVFPVDVDAPRQLRRLSAPLPTLFITQDPQFPAQGKRNRKAKPQTVPISTELVNSNIVSSRNVSTASRKMKAVRKRGTTNASSRIKKRPVRRVVAEAYPAEVVGCVQAIPTSLAVATAGGFKKAMLSVAVEPSSTTSALVEHYEEEEEDDNDEEEREDGVVDDKTKDGVKDGHLKDSDTRNDFANLPRAITLSPSTEFKRGRKRKSCEASSNLNYDKAQENECSDEELSNLRGSKVKFVHIRDHESPEATSKEVLEPAAHCYVICQDSSDPPKKSPTVSNFKMKIKKID